MSEASQAVLGASSPGDEIRVEVVVDEAKLAAALEQVQADLNARVAELAEPLRGLVSKAYHAGVADGQRATAAAAK